MESKETRICTAFADVRAGSCSGASAGPRCSVCPPVFGPEVAPARIPAGEADCKTPAAVAAASAEVGLCVGVAASGWGCATGCVCCH